MRPAVLVFVTAVLPPCRRIRDPRRRSASSGTADPRGRPQSYLRVARNKSFAAAEAEQLAAKGWVAVWLTIKRALPSGRVSRYTDLSVGPYLTVVKRHGGEL
jgi:hypothetical protein